MPGNGKGLKVVQRENKKSKKKQEKELSKPDGEKVAAVARHLLLDIFSNIFFSDFKITTLINYQK